MHRIFLTALLATLFAFSATAQDDAGDADSGAAAAPAESEDSATADGDEEDTDDADLDEQTYEEDDDDFIPSEEIPADEPIPFPSNI